ERVEGTIATVVAGILNGANIVRVHDVKENKRAITVTENILAAK
ncbi:MAG: dihydropteroate synthase, partial [bacterium]